MEGSDIYNNLQNLVEKELKTLGYENSNIRFSKGTITGDNYLAVITLIDINTKTADDGKPIKLHWIAKTAHQNKQLREHIKINLIYSREIYMYTHILPVFAQLQKKRNISEVFRSYPNYIKGSLEEMNETIIMENLKAKGFIMKNRREPLDYTHTKYVFTNYAKFHALSFALRDQDPDKFHELTENIQGNFFDHSSRESMQPTYTLICERMSQCYTENNPEELKLLRYLIEYGYDVVSYSSRSDSLEKYGIIIHGDSWINNMLFKYENHEEPESPTQMVLIDFQLARVGSPAADLTYFLYTCTDGELREKHYTELLTHYYQVFSDFLKDLGSDPDKLFPREVFLDHMEKFSAYGILMSMMVLHLMLSDTDEIPDMTAEELDLESFKYETRNVGVYQARVKDIIRDVIKYEYDLYTKE